MKVTKLLLLLVGLLTSVFLFGQTTITGKITDAKTGLPIPGVSVKIKATRSGAVTNDNGVFTIKAAPTDVLEITAIGYSSTKVAVGNEMNLSLNLEASITDLSGVVLVGTRRPGRGNIET